jgi:signal transduction histidine kinase
MRRLLGVLREEPAAAGSNGIAGNGNGGPTYAPQPGLRDLDALVDRVRGTGLDVAVRQAGAPFEVSGAAGLTVYRIVQEALTNALKHAEEPASVAVRLEFDDPDVSVRITDDGRAAVSTPAANGNGRTAAASGGHGLAGMAERASAFGGALRAGPRREGGWEVEATLRDCKAPART